MSVFRSPLYLDIETMIPLANYHDIEVMTDIAVSQRDRGERSGRAGLTVSLPIPGSPGIDVGGSGGSETEVTQERIVKSHPADALNRLLDSLQREGELSNDLINGQVRRHQIVEIDREWEISPATDIGSILTPLISVIAANPAIMAASEPPAEVISSLMGSQSTQGRVVLDATPEGDVGPRVLVLLESDQLVGKATLDDLTEERTVFGQVDAFVAEGGTYSLEKFFLSGISRGIRRSFPLENILSGFKPMLGREVSPSDLKVAGPVVVVKAIAIY